MADPGIDVAFLLPRPLFLNHQLPLDTLAIRSNSTHTPILSLLYTFTRPLPPKSLSIRALAPSGFALLPPPACAKPATSAPTPLVSGVSPLLPSLDLAVLDSDYRPLLSPLPTFALTVLSIRPSISPGKTTVPRSTRETTPPCLKPALVRRVFLLARLSLCCSRFLTQTALESSLSLTLPADLSDPEDDDDPSFARRSKSRQDSNSTDGVNPDSGRSRCVSFVFVCVIREPTEATLYAVKEGQEDDHKARRRAKAREA